MNARKIFSGVAFNYLGVVVTSLSGFLATPIVIHHLGHRVFGEWALISSILSYSSLMDFGIGITVMRSVAERAHLADRTELNRIASTGLVLFSALGLLVATAGIIIAFFAHSLFHVARGDSTDFTTALMILSVMMGVTFPAGLYTGINQGFGRYRQQNTIVIFQSVGGAVGGVVAVLLGGGLLALTASWSLFAFAGFLTKAIYARRAYRLSASFRRYDGATARSLIAMSAWMFVINIAWRVIWDSDTIVIGGVLGAVAVTRYSVALGPATAVRRITDQFSSVSLTAASGLHARSELDSLRRLLTEGTRMTMIVIGPFLILFAVWGRQFLSLWVGPSLRSSATTLVILLAGMLAASIQSAASQVLVALGRQKILAIIALLEAAANLGLSIALAHPLGVEGVALGTAIPTTITGTFLSLPYAARLVGARPATVLRRLLLPASVFVAGFCVARLTMASLHFSSLLVFGVFAGLFVGVLALLSIILDREERHTYLGLLAVLRRSPQRAG